MSDNDSGIDAIMAQADPGDEEASQDSIDALFGDAADDGDGLSIDEIWVRAAAMLPSNR